MTTPEQASAAQSAAAQTATPARGLPSVVVPTGGSASTSLGALPTGTTAVTITFQGVGAWRDTTVTAAVGPSEVTTFVITAKQGDNSTSTVTLPVAATHNGRLTMWSSRASVEMRTTLVSSKQTTTVPSGGRTSVPIGPLPAGATGLKVKLTSTQASQNTVLSAAVGPNGQTVAAFTAPANQTASRTLVLSVPASPSGRITLSSSRATITVSVTVLKYVIGATPTTPPVTPTTPPVAPTTPPVAPAVPAGTPSADNTGVPAGVALTRQTGDIHVTTAGTVISGLDLQGRIYIEAPNVTVKNSIIRGSATGWSGGSALIVAMGGHANALITDTELVPTVTSGYANGILGSNFTATRLDIHDVIDGIHVVGDNVTLQSSWLHDNVHLENDPNQNGTPSHDDSIQIQKGTNIVIDNNNISGAVNAAMQVTQDAGVVSQIRFSNNSANNGACTINIAEKGRGAIQGIVIRDNKFGRDTANADCAVISARTTAITMERNFYVPDNTAVTVRTGG